MNRLFRTFLFLPALVLALVILPLMALSTGFGPDGFSGKAYAAPDEASVSQPQFYDTYGPPPSGTVPRPTPPHRHRRPFPTVTPTRIYYYTPPTPTAIPPTATPMPTATPIAAGSVFASGHHLKKVIGDRLSNVIYGYTTDEWLYRSPDNGVSWNLVTTSPQVDDFIMNAANPNVLYSGKGAPCPDDSKTNEPMYKSTNGGLTWDVLPDSTNKRPLLSHQGDPNSLFAADCKTPYVTTDGGQTWMAKPDTSSEALWNTYHVIHMAAASMLGNPRPDKPNWDQIFGGGISTDGSGVVVFSNDQGKTWVRLTPKVEPASWGMTTIAVDPFIEGLIGFTEPKGVWTTENYGVDWKFI